MLCILRRIGLPLFANKVSDLLLSPKTTLPALLSFAGATAFLIFLAFWNIAWSYRFLAR